MSPVNPIGTPFLQLNQVDSTNNYAMGQVQAQMAEHGIAYLAHEQTSGRGQRGNTWKSAAGLNLTMSVVVEPRKIGLGNQASLAMAVALACADVVNQFVRQYTTIKWPNDIYWKDRKAGGILIENVLQGKDWKHSVIGIGINLNQTSFADGLLNPVSVKQVTGVQYDIAEVAKFACANLEERWQQLARHEYAELLQEYNSRLFRLNEVVEFEMENAKLTARVVGVNEYGELLVDTGNITAIPFGSVKWIL